MSLDDMSCVRGIDVHVHPSEVRNCRVIENRSASLILAGTQSI